LKGLFDDMSDHDGISNDASIDVDNGSLSLSEQLNHAEQRNKESIFSKALASRPKSTKNAFDREQLNHAEQRNKESIFSKALASRPKSTKNAFDRKQDEFVQWSVSKGYSPLN